MKEIVNVILKIKLLFEPAHEIMILSVLRKLILQTRMRSHPVWLDVWFLVGPFVYFHTVCVGGTHLISIKFGRSFDHYQIRFSIFIPPKFLNFQVYLEYLIHSRIKSKLNQYVFTLTALDPRVYILAYDFDLFSVPVHFNASLYKRMVLFFSIRHYIEYFINSMI